MISPMEHHGLFQYWIDFEETGEITSVRYLQSDLLPSQSSVFWLKKCSVENLNSVLNEIENLAQGVSPGTGYLTSLEKIGGLVETAANFYNAGAESFYSGLRKLADSKLPSSLVKIAICALEGNLHGLIEAKSALTLITCLLSLPRLGKVFLESSGLPHLLLLITHPSASSQMVSRVLQTLNSLISVPENFYYFTETDFTLGLDNKTLQSHFVFPKKTRKDELKKQKTEEDFCYKTGYQVMFGLLNEKKSVKVGNNLKVLLNKCAFYSLLQKFNTQVTENSISIIESIRKNLKLQMLRSTTHAFPSVKHDLLTFLLLDSGLSLGNLQGSAQFLSQPVLTNSLADWLSFTKFLPNLLSFFLSQTSNLEDYRIAFINICDILLMLIRSQGGFGYITANADLVTGFVHAFQGLLIPTSTEEAEFNLIEEEYLLSAITMEKVPSYARQMGLILTTLLRLSEQLNAVKNGRALAGLTSLYASLSTEDGNAVVSSVFYTVIRFQPDLLLWLAEQIDLNSEADMLRTFYIIEIIKIALQEDRSGEVMVLIGQDLTEIISSIGTRFSELQETLDILTDWLKPISKVKNGDVEMLVQEITTNAKVKKEKIETKAPFFVIGESSYPDFDVLGLGDLNTKGSVILQLLPSLRILNLILSIKKWTSIQLIGMNFLPILTNIVSKVTQILHTLYCKSNTKEVFNLLNSISVKNEHFELLLPCLNMFNMLLEQFLGTELLMYNNSPMLESILHISALCELEIGLGTEFLKAKLLRIIKTTFILWAQLPNFIDIYLPVIFEHAFQYPFKRSAVLTIIGSIFEYYVSTKDPAFYHKCAEWMVKPSFCPLFGPELLYYYIIQASNLEGEFKIMAGFQLPQGKAKDNSSSKYEYRNAWEYKRYLGLLMDREATVIDKCFSAMFNTENFDIHIGFIRLLRCVLASSSLSAGEKIMQNIKKLLDEKANFRGKALFMLQAVSDIPCAKAICIHDDIPEILIGLLKKKEFSIVILKIFKDLFDISITSNEDEKYTFSEDLPTISQTQCFLLEIREFLLFDIPGAEDEVMEEDDDLLYGEFTRQKPNSNEISWEFTNQVLIVLKELTSNLVGRSLVLCGHYPYKDISGPLDFQGLLRRISIGLSQHEWQEICMNLLSHFMVILKHIGSSMLTSESLQTLSSQLSMISSPKAASLLLLLNTVPIKPELQFVELPNPRDLILKFPSKNPDFGKIKEFGKNLKKNHFNQLVNCKRFGEKTQVKATQFLTDLLPPPYPPQFKYKSEIRLAEWSTFNESYQEFTADKVIEKLKVTEDKMKKVQPPQNYTPNVQNDMMAKQNMQPMPSMPVQPPNHQPRNVMLQSQNNFTDAEKSAYNELLALLQKKDKSQDPRLQLRIEQLLSEYPNLCSYLKS